MAGCCAGSIGRAYCRGCLLCFLSWSFAPNRFWNCNRGSWHSRCGTRGHNSGVVLESLQFHGWNRRHCKRGSHQHRCGGFSIPCGTGNRITNAPAVPLLIAAVGGFLIWNWPPARIFMGDAGSGFLGFFSARLLGGRWLRSANHLGLAYTFWHFFCRCYSDPTTPLGARRIPCDRPSKPCISAPEPRLWQPCKGDARGPHRQCPLAGSSRLGGGGPPILGCRVGSDRLDSSGFRAWRCGAGCRAIDRRSPYRSRAQASSSIVVCGGRQSKSVRTRDGVSSNGRASLRYSSSRRAVLNPHSRSFGATRNSRAGRSRTRAICFANSATLTGSGSATNMVESSRELSRADPTIRTSKSQRFLMPRTLRRAAILASGSGNPRSIQRHSLR